MTSVFLKTALGMVAGASLSSCALQEGMSSPAAKGLPAPPSAELVAKDAKSAKKDKYGMATYQSNQRRRVVRTTAYSHMENEPGAPGRKNAVGTTLQYDNKVRSAAADWSVYPVGTKFRIKGLPYLYIVDDYGSSLAGTNTLDIYNPTLELMHKWGTRKAEIVVVQWGSFERSRQILSGRTGYWHCRKMHSAIVKKLNSEQLAKLDDVENTQM